MSVALVGKAPYRQVLAYERVTDETGRAMHKSWGNAIELNEALERMGADVMRWLFCSQVPSQNLNFGFGLAREVKRELLTFWNSVSFLILYANVEGWRPAAPLIESGPARDDLAQLDRWLLARVQKLVAEANEGFERFWTPAITKAFTSFMGALSDWYVRRSRPRFWRGEEAALETLWYAVVQALRTIAPLMPFLSDHLWRNLVAGPCDDAPESIFLAGWPEVDRDLED